MNETFITVISGILTFFFIFASSIKILGWQKMIFETQLALFHKYGLSRTLMALIGFVELFGAITLWLPDYFGLCGVLALFGTSAGAIFFHLRFDTWKDGIPAMVTLVLSGIVGFAKYSALTI
jgi:DoxX-like family